MGLIPGILFFWQTANGQIKLRLLEILLGLWALRFIIASLAITPLRRLGGPSLIRFRRALGLLAFFYACAHMMVYLPVALDQREDLRGMVSDILSKPFIAIGMLAFLILVPLAVTSNAPMIKRLGVSAWQNLHRWVYVAAIAATVHFLMAALMASKTGTLAAEQLAYPALIAALLLIRVILAARKRWSSAVPRAA